MTERCLKHNIELTETGECLECSKLRSSSVSGDNQPDENTDFREKDSDVIDSKESSEPDTQPENTPSNNTINIEKTKAKNLSTTQTGNVGIINQVFGNLSQLEKDESIFTVSLFERSEPTEFKDYGELTDRPPELIADFKRERILILGDPGDKSSRRIAHQIAHALKVDYKKGNFRLLSLSKFKANALTFEGLSPKRESSDNTILDPALIIVNALKQGEEFTDALLNNDGSLIDHYPFILRNNNLYLICLIDGSSINYWSNQGISEFFPYWIISNQKKETSGDENKFEVSRKFEGLPNSDHPTDAKIIRTILFIVAFFPDLTAGDFNDLIDQFLRNEPDITWQEQLPSDSGTSGLMKISLREVWKSKSGFFTEICFLTNTKDETGRRVINFQNKNYGEHIKSDLENRYWAFVDEKISQILEMRLIFHPSDNIANQSTDILSEYLPGNEEKFIDWILWVVNILNDAENQAENLRRLLGIRDDESSMNTEETGRKYFYYNRLDNLFRKILKNPSLKETVSTIMGRLIQDQCYQSALMMTKKLHKAANFDEFYWLRQLLERGDGKTERDIETYLINNLVKKDVDDVFKKLKDWLPNEENSSGNYSQANKMALQLLIKYFSYQINVFDEKLYGTEPPLFPLFDFENKTSPNEQLARLAKYLLHPAKLGSTLQDTPYILYAAFLIEKWAEILCKNNSSKKTTAAAAVSNAEILNMLLEKVILALNENEQEIIKDFWKTLMDINDSVSKIDTDWETREQAFENREFLANLIEVFNDRQWALQ